MKYTFPILLVILAASVGLFSIPNINAQGTIPMTPTPGSIYFPLVSNDLPTPLPFVTSTPINPPVHGVLSFKSVRSVRSYGDLFLIGEIINGASYPIAYPVIQAKFFDADDHIVATTDAYAYLEKTIPGQVNPFKFALFNAPVDITHFEVGLIARGTDDIRAQPITILSQQVRDNLGIEVFGEIRNDLPGTIRQVFVIATFYDADQRVIDEGLGVTEDVVEPGQSAPYLIKMSAQFDYASYALQSESNLLAPTPDPKPFRSGDSLSASTVNVPIPVSPAK